MLHNILGGRIVEVIESLAAHIGQEGVLLVPHRMLANFGYVGDILSLLIKQ